MKMVKRNYQIVADIDEIEVPVNADDEEIAEYIKEAIEKGMDDVDVLQATEYRWPKIKKEGE